MLCRLRAWFYWHKRVEPADASRRSDPSVEQAARKIIAGKVPRRGLVRDRFEAGPCLLWNCTPRKCWCTIRKALRLR